MPTQRLNTYIECFEADKRNRRFQVYLIDGECHKYEMCNQKVFFLLGYILEYKRLCGSKVGREFRFQVYDYDYDTIYHDMWVPVEFRNVFWDVLLFNMCPSPDTPRNLWILYDDDHRKNKGDVIE